MQRNNALLHCQFSKGYRKKTLRTGLFGSFIDAGRGATLIPDCLGPVLEQFSGYSIDVNVTNVHDIAV